MPKEKVIKGDKSILDQKIIDLERKYGSGSIIHGTNVESKFEVISTGSLALDAATYIGGIPIGVLIEWMGMDSSGKSSGIYHVISEFQKAGKTCVLCDGEQSFSREYAENIGVQMDKLIIISPECQEDAYNLIQELISTGVISLVCVDSHTSLQPKRLIEGEIGDSLIGLQARINSQALGKIKPMLRPNKCTMIGVSQIRQQVGAYGDINQSTGGLAWRFYSDMRFKFSKQVDKAGEGNLTTVEVIKSKCGSPFGKAQFTIGWGIGIDKLKEIIDYAAEFSLITKVGAGWYTIGETKMQGDNKVKQFLQDNPDYTEQLKQEVLTKLKTI